MAGLGTWLRGLFGAKKAGSPPRRPLPPAGSQPIGLDSSAADNNEFALAMYGRLRQEAENLFFSPFSIRTALGMTVAGARGETAEQMREALRIPSSDETVHAALAEIIRRLCAAGDGKAEMTVANSLWCQDGSPLLPGFLDLIARHYTGGVNLVDFDGDAEAARVRINRWADEVTKQRIQGLIPPGNLNEEMRLVLVNAVHFKGVWAVQFRRKDTRDEPFHAEGGRTVQAPLMYQRKEVRYRQGEGYQAVDLAYGGGRLSMLVLLPDRKDGLGDLEKTISAHMLHDCATYMGTREVEVFLPRFKITWGVVDLGAQLAALGMPLAFTRFLADFSGINGYEPPHEESLFLSAVLHKAFVETNEEGTEAAAATAVAMRLTTGIAPSTPSSVPVFRADHPFLFAIRDRASGAVLFLGRVVDPTREG